MSADDPRSVNEVAGRFRRPPKLRLNENHAWLNREELMAHVSLRFRLCWRQLNCWLAHGRLPVPALTVLSPEVRKYAPVSRCCASRSWSSFTRISSESYGLSM